MEKFTKINAEKYIRTTNDAQVAQLGHLNAIVEAIKPTVKTYVALLNQAAANAPIAKVLENTIGNITWSRGNAGIYVALLTGGFPEDKVVCYASRGYKTASISTLTFSRFNEDYCILTNNDTSLQTQVDVQNALYDLTVRIDIYF